MHVLQIVSRTGKLAYEWRGLKHLPELLDRLVADQVSHHEKLLLNGFACWQDVLSCRHMLKC